ncbi:sensor domain-containing protein [Nocardia transvalensis]|uniref:sensor domain-containing protein n=1 Tax=Nocardia transvalensis TaxID=37333 RepID=UPI0018963BFF|nr:sensor domain-containing protein [Nocardia transvalensis]MBF6330138.1 sensor domain-containing protein [Nocardia transvalensis]
MGRVKHAGWLLAGVVACAGCGSQQQDSLPGFGPAVTPAPVSAPAVTDSAALQARLLTAADLPPGYTRLDDAAPGNGPQQPADRSRTDPASCAKVLAPVGDQASGASARGAVHYSTPDFAGIDIDIASYPNGGAAQAFSTVQNLVRQCGKYSGTDADGTAMDYRTGGLDQPKAGDASTSFQVHTTSEGVTLYTAATVVLVGSSVVQIAESAPTPIDPATLRDLTAKQVMRLQGVLGP